MMSDQRGADLRSGADRVMVYSSDTHVGPRMQDFRPYCPQKYLSQFEDFAASPYAQPERGLEAFLKTFSDEYRNGAARNSKTNGHWDPHARLRDMDRDGVSGGVVFHNSLNGQPFPLDYMNSFASGHSTSETRELIGVGRQIYNRWLADFVSVEPHRNLGLAQLPFWDIDAATRELEWAADHGLNGVNFPAPGAFGNVQPSDPTFDRFFAAAAALDMTLATHIGAMPPTEHPFGGMNGEGDHCFLLLDNTEWGIRVVYSLVYYGVFERHPDLKLVVTEIPGVFWDEMNRKLDSVYKSPVRRLEHSLTKLPSEYTASNVWMGNSFQSRPEAISAIAIGREDRFMWGSDYPHSEGTFSYSEDPAEYPMTRLSLANTYHGLPLDKVRKLVGENVFEAFPRVDPAELYKVAERIGPTVDEIATKPDLGKYDYVTNTGTLAFRTEGAWN